MNFEHYEKLHMLECYIVCNKNSELASERYFQEYPERRQPHPKMFKRLYDNLYDFGSFVKPRSRNYNPGNDIQEERIFNVIGSVTENPNISSREITANVGVAKSTALRILKKHRYRPYKVRKVQALHDGDSARRSDFCRWFLEREQEDGDFFRRIIWTDEVRITSDGIFNKYNHHVWADVNPRQTMQNQIVQGRFGFNVWCAILGNRILAFEIFQENLDSIRYLRILRDNIEPFVENLPLNVANQIYYQQDGAPAHNSRIVRQFLQVNFADKIISTNGPIRWPPRSPDLTPPDFFLWGYVKDKLYKLDNRAPEVLRNNFEAIITSISNVHLLNATRSVGRRCEKCLQQNGLQFEHFL